MNLSKNSWHYRFLDRWEEHIIRMFQIYGTPINLCPYVRAVFFRLVVGFLLLPPTAAFAIFVAISPITYLFFWGITGMWNELGWITGAAIVACSLYAASLFVLAIAGLVELISNYRPDVTYVEDTLLYQTAKSWHDKVCPIMDIKE